MINIAIAFIAGISAFRFHSYFPITISSLLFGTILYLFFMSYNRKKMLLIIMVFVAAFIYSMLRHHDLPALSVPAEDVYIVGTISSVPEMKDGNLRFSIRDVLIEDISIPGTVRLTILQEVFGESLRSSMLEPGDRLHADAKLKTPRSFYNPGVYAPTGAINDISAVGYVRGFLVTAEDEGFMTWIHKKRQRLGWIMDNSLSEESALLHKAIIPGLKSGVGQEMRDGFSSTGLAHLLSISGTHFGLLGFIIFSFIRGGVRYMPFNMLVRMSVTITPTQIAVLITLPVLMLYALISGASLPTIRSLVMVIIYMAALFLGRKGQWLNSLAIAVVVILIWQPEALFALSFQLSFFAVLSIGAVMERIIHYENTQSDLMFGAGNHNIDRPDKKVWKKIRTTLLITIAAVMGTAPFVVMYFNQLPLISPLTNLIITPLICFVVLPLGFFTGFTALLFDMPLMPLSYFTDMVTHSALKLVKMFSHIPYANVPLHSPTIAEIFLYYSALIYVVKSNNSFHKKFLPVVIVFFIYLIRPHMANDNFSITFLDVGQGESSVLKLPGDDVMIIDGGMNKPDMGRRVIAPFLRSRAIDTVDYLVVSHAHPDHFGGFRYILEHFQVREIWTNGDTIALKPQILNISEKQKVRHRVLKRGDMLGTDRYTITILHPYQSFYADSPRGVFSNENSSSLVLNVEAEDISILFTGDIEEEAEENILYADIWLKSDIMKIPHHGGRTSSSSAFIKSVQPQVAVVSAGRNNPFHHPHTSAMQRYRDEGVNIFRTDRDGAVSVKIKNGRYEVTTYQDSTLVPVRHWKDEMRNVRLLFGN